jgi:SHS2 domain-containing protein
MARMTHFDSFGESFDPEKHSCGTEVKAITSSNLQVSTTAPHHIYVIFDI